MIVAKLMVYFFVINIVDTNLTIFLQIIFNDIKIPEL